MLQVHASVFSAPETDGEEKKEGQMIERRAGIPGRTPPGGRAGIGDGELRRGGGDKGSGGEDAATEHGDERLKR